jgi:hypothetical protein
MRTASLAGASLALAALLTSFTAFAGPADTVESPIVEQGEREIEFKAGHAGLRDSPSASAASIGIGWGVTQRWFTELSASWHKDPEEGTGFDAWEWENRFQLTETGRWPVDVGLLLEIERPKNRAEGYEVRWGPMFQADVTNDVQANFNLLFEKHVRSAEPSRTEMQYQWQVKYRYKPEFEFGAQGFGEVGPWDHWAPHSEQAHIAGPAIFGKLKAGSHQVISYNAAVLFGLNHAAPRHTFRLQAEYEF